MARSDPAVTRRKPRQARAEQTVQLIFDATALVLREEGEAALTTNRIAARAGVSIGTLYQYFDGKEAILLAILSRTRQRLVQQLDALVSQADAHSPDPNRSDPRVTLRAFVRAYVKAYGVGSGNERELVRMAWRLDTHESLVSALREAGEHVAVHLERLRHPLLRPPTPAMVFVLTRALAGIVRSASLEASPLLGTSAFEDELVNVCWSIMKTPQG